MPDSPFDRARLLASTVEPESVERIGDGLVREQIDLATIQIVERLASADWLDDERRTFAQDVCAAWLDELRQSAEHAG